MKNQGLKTIVFLTMAVILASGIISCAEGTDGITGSGGISYSSENAGGNTSGGRLNTSFPIWPKNYRIYTDDNPGDYYNIRVPFAVGGDGYTNVSYKDTNTLKQLWFEQINRKAVNDGKVFAIRNRDNNRDANNFQSRQTDGQYSAQDYYFFDDNGDIIYKEDHATIKKFIGAVIIPYRDVTIKKGNYKNSWALQENGITWTEKNIYTIGGVYSNALTTERARDKYASDNPFKDGVYDFVTARHWVQTFWSGAYFENTLFERQYIEPGFIEVFVMYDYDNFGYSGAAAVHSYYPYYGKYNYYKDYFTPKNMQFMTNQKIYLRQRPEFITKQLNHTAMFTASWCNWEYLFMPGHRD